MTGANHSEKDLKKTFRNPLAVLVISGVELPHVPNDGAPIERSEPTEKDRRAGSPSNRRECAKVALIARSGNCPTGWLTEQDAQAACTESPERRGDPRKGVAVAGSVCFGRKTGAPGPPEREGSEADSQPSRASACWD